MINIGHSCNREWYFILSHEIAHYIYSVTNTQPLSICDICFEFQSHNLETKLFVRFCNLKHNERNGFNNEKKNYF